MRGTVRVPGDKSISHRALLVAAFARGTSRIRGVLHSDDVESTATVLRTMGWPLPALAPSLAIAGGGLRSPLVTAPARRLLACGNSGTTTRLLAGVAAAQPFASTFVGDRSLSRRPMQRVAAPLEAMGARVEFPSGGDGLPMTVHGGALRPIDWTLPVASAQLKSAILLAALCAGVEARVVEPVRTRDHTERMLRAAGVEVAVEGAVVVLTPARELAPLELDVPGDPSSAAFFAVLAALGDSGSVSIEGISLNPQRIGFLSVLRRMGVAFELRERADAGGEPVGDLVVHAGPVRGTTVDPAEIPSLVDEIPVLAVLAARAEGETIVRGASELRVKESDRIAATVANLRAVGVDADELPDGLVVRGGRGPLRGTVITHGDHRIAMAFAVLGATRDCAITVDDPGCVAVSYPAFWQDLQDVLG